LRNVADPPARLCSFFEISCVSGSSEFFIASSYEGNSTICT
jgi:hypothetical protein